MSHVTRQVTTARRWMLTVNNYSDEEIEAIRQCHKIKFFCGQPEMGENGTLHFQCYIETVQPERLSAIKKICPRAHIEVARKPRAACISYCTKMDSRVSDPITTERSRQSYKVCRRCPEHNKIDPASGGLKICFPCWLQEKKEFMEWCDNQFIKSFHTEKYDETGF